MVERSEEGRVQDKSARARVAELKAENARLHAELKSTTASRAAGATEQQLRLIVESATDYAILTTDLERQVTSWSAGAEATFGYAAGEIIGQSGDILFTCEDRAAGAPEEEAGTACREGVAPDVRWHQRKDGSAVFLSGSTRLLRDAEGRAIGFLKVARDDTERRLAADRLHEAGELAASQAAEREAILGQLAEGVIVTDTEGQITFVNDAAEALHGVKLLGVDPDSYTASYHLLTEAGEPYPPRELPLARAVLLGETVVDARWRIRRPDGTEVLAIGSARPIVSADGLRVGAVLTLRDDTSRRASEVQLSRLAAVIEQSSDFIGIATPDGRAFYLNEAGRRIVGLKSLDDVRQTRVIEYFAPEDVPFVEQVILPTQMRDGRWVGEFPFRRFDTGEKVPMHYNQFVIRDEAGGVIGVAAVARDISEEKRRADALQSSEEFNRRILQASPDCIKVLDLNGRLEFMSEGGMCVMEVDDLGVIKGACWPDFWSGEEHSKAIAAVEKAKAGRVGQFQGLAPTMKGNLRSWDVIVSPINGPDGKPDKLLSVSRDVTASKRAEAQLRVTSRRLDAILNNTREAVFLMDHRQHCVYANSAAEALTGYTFLEMQGRPLHDVVHHKKPDGSHYPLEECPIDQAFPERAQMSGEELFVHKDGSFYPVAFTASPVLDEARTPIGTVIEARNIADRKARDEALRESEARLRELNETLELQVAERTADLDRTWRLSQDLLAVAE